MPKAFPIEFRNDVVAVARKGEAPIAQIAKDFGISESCLANWLKKAGGVAHHGRPASALRTGRHAARGPSGRPGPLAALAYRHPILGCVCHHRRSATEYRTVLPIRIQSGPLPTHLSRVSLSSVMPSRCAASAGVRKRCSTLPVISVGYFAGAGIGTQGDRLEPQ